MAARILIVGLFLATLASAGAAQRVAILTPDGADSSKTFAAKLETALDGKVKLIDDSLARSAFDASGLASPYNLSLDEAKRAGAAIGCDFFVLVRAAIQRRSSFEKAEYYEAYAFLFVVSSRTGRLIGQAYAVHAADKPADALTFVDSQIPREADAIVKETGTFTRSELDEKPSRPIDEMPDENSSAAANFRAPVPFRRIKPEYTKLADQYDVTATVDVVVDLDADGKVLRTEVTRWAGYDLDESVVETVMAMNWRPAERDGKFVPARFLVRYNFKKARQAKTIIFTKLHIREWPGKVGLIRRFGYNSRYNPNLFVGAQYAFTFVSLFHGGRHRYVDLDGRHGTSQGL